MAQPVSAVAIARLRSAWDGEVRPSARRALVALVGAVFFGAAHLARVGTQPARIAALAALAATLLVIVVRWAILRRRRADARKVIADTVARMDPELGAATLRAITLAGLTASLERSGSPELAALHVQRLLSRASTERIAERAGRTAASWSGLGLALGALAAAAVFIEPFRVVEGLDVLASRDGEAPLELAWIDRPMMVATPPDYLHRSASDPVRLSPTAEARGTTLTVRGRPLHPGRTVVLTDGQRDVPFVDDGSGGLVARWITGDTTKLAIAVNFGGVRIYQAERHTVTSIQDHPPVVKVEGAPRTVRLLEEPHIKIHYEATDDHGLREVDLVLRAGTREERRVLSHPAADVLIDRGGYDIHAKDPFLLRTYTPIEVTVEARDNDVVAGPKWGKSAPIVVIPPQVGEPEALRFQALLKARDALTDLTAFRVTDKAPVGAATKEHLDREAAEQDKAARVVTEVLAASYGGLETRGRLPGMARGQLRRLARSLAAEKKTPTSAAHQKLVEETEEALLALDIGIRSLGARNSRTVAKRLADVADEAAGALSTVRATAGLAEPPPGAAADRKAAEARLDAAVAVLDGGGQQLLRLGELGVDLGEIVGNDLKRVARARKDSDLLHAELAARDLAARLRHPDPSFSGGGGRGSGVESGGGKGSQQGADGAEGEASAAEQEAAAGEHELEELIKEHEGKVAEVENALEKAISPQELEALQKEAKEHADAIREAVKRLPPPRGRNGSAEAAAAAAREEAEAMAGALEGGRPRDAIQNGKRAAQKLAEAMKLGDQSGNLFPNEQRAGRDAAGAKPTIDRELQWAEDALDKLRKSAASRAKGDLKQGGKDEGKLAERAKELGKKGENGDRSMPQDKLDRLTEAEQAMRDASRALNDGDGENGSRLQRDAQRLLEMARGERENESESSKDPKGTRPQGKAEIPGTSSHRGPDDFRRRVIKGLGGSSDPLLREAVKRYAEGLLK